MSTFDAEKHMISLKGKKYLPVAARVLWFRTEHPTGAIVCDLLSTEPVIVKATVLVDGAIVATAHGTAQAKQGAVWSGREIEKAETAALGRALGLAGYGTQFGDEFDDTEHLADSPAAPRSKPTPAPAPKGAPKSNGAAPPNGAPPAVDTRGAVLCHKVTTHKATNGKIFLRLHLVGRDPVVVFTRQLFRAAGVACDDWTQPDMTIPFDVPLHVWINDTEHSASVTAIAAPAPSGLL